MPTTHDGIACRLPPNPARLGVGVALLAAGAWAAFSGAVHPVLGGAVALVGLFTSLNQLGSRRVRVIESKLLVEDMHLITGLLIGPTRSRIEWDRVQAVKVEGGALRLDTDGAPFVTAQGAAAADLAFLLQKADFAFQKFKKGGA